MYNKIILIILIFLSIFTSIYSQLSPGTLYKGHRDLEGLSNCTECHEFGKKVSNKKCLNCHKEIQTLISNKKGYHYSPEVRKKDCAECHSDHHGLNFQIIRFDEDNFDHNLSGYPLKGKHSRIDCKECHKPDYISDKELRKNNDTYLGMGTDCLSCHDDYHKGDLSVDCINCHNYNKFTEIEKFDHNKSNYPLKGKHKKVDCDKCHQIEIIGENKFQKFKNIAFKNCTDCHNDVHNGSLGRNCNNCHNESTFDIKVVKKLFNHNKKTKFKLKGKHKRVACFECHSPDLPKTTIFSDYKKYSIYDCNKCHDDAHDGRFGQDCNSCHTENSFNIIKSINNFNHNLTKFTLVGKHQQVECKKCHIHKLIDPLPHDNCIDCHDDYHEGELKENKLVIDCKKCHTENGFEDFDYDIKRHKLTSFPLIESHEATPCFACHQKDGQKKWKFQSIGKRCIDCHDNIHEGELKRKYFPQQDCKNCHTESAWDKIETFDHSKTKFVLNGKHLKIECIDCHKSDTKNIKVKFKNLPLSCDKCHNDEHHGQFDKNGSTDCSECHTPDNWDASKFDHNKTTFKLKGAHQNVSCDKCHNTGERGFILYKNGKLKCINCHK